MRVIVLAFVLAGCAGHGQGQGQGGESTEESPEATLAADAGVRADAGVDRPVAAPGRPDAGAVSRDAVVRTDVRAMQTDGGVTAERLGLLTVTFLRAHDGIFIRTPSGETYLFDVSNQRDWSFIRRFLTSANVSTLSGFIASHPHSDHYDGANLSSTTGLLREFKVERLFDAGQTTVPGWGGYDRTVVDLAASKGIPRTGSLREGMKVALDPQLTVEVLSPRTTLFTAKEAEAANGYDTDANHANENSLVLRIVHGKVSFLLTGDIHDLAMDTLIENHPEEIAVHVLIIPHHGNGRNYAPFMRATRATVAVAQYNSDHLPEDPAGNARNWAGLYRWQTATTHFFHPFANLNPTDVDLPYPADGNVTVVSNGRAFNVHGETSGRAFTYVVP